MTMRAPSGLNCALLTLPSCPASVARLLPVAASHTRAVLSLRRGDDARAVRAELRAQHVTLMPGERGEVLPVAASHTRAVLSPDAVTMRVPSGLNCALVTPPHAPRAWRGSCPSPRPTPARSCRPTR